MKGRSWEGIDESAGLSSFTAAEIAEDYGLPLETVMTEIKRLGLNLNAMSPVDSPIKSVCSEDQAIQMGWDRMG